MNKKILIIIGILLLIGVLIYILWFRPILIGDILHSEQTSPGNGTHDRFVALATNEAAFDHLWNNFNFSELRPDINTEKFILIFLHTVENSCPKSIHRMMLKDDETELVISTSPRGLTCDDIAISKSFVVKVERNMIEHIDTIVFEGEAFSLPDAR